MRLAGSKLNRLVLVLLTLLAILMLAEGLLGLHGDGRPFFETRRCNSVPASPLGFLSEASRRFWALPEGNCSFRPSFCSTGST